MTKQTPRTCWDKDKACKRLGIPYRIVEMGKEVGGFSELNKRYIKINERDKDKTRVWVHELAHTLLHFKNIEAAAGRDMKLNAIAELEADTVAYIVCKVLGCEDRAEYLSYVKCFTARIPANEQSVSILDERMPKLLNIVNIILKAGK